MRSDLLAVGLVLLTADALLVRRRPGQFRGSPAKQLPTGDSWRAELHFLANGPAVGPLDELLTPDRQWLSNGLERWILKVLADVCFELPDEADTRGRLLVRTP